MAEFNEVYRRAMYYDIVFKRDVSHEVDFIIDVYKQHHDKPPNALLDLACGPGYHARNFAARDYRAVGLDLREEMLSFAQHEAHQEQVLVEWLHADMRYVQLQEPVDVAINVFDGIDCLLTNDDLITHMRCIADNLTSGGLYYIDVTHPRLTNLSYYEPFQYKGQRDSITVEVRWRGDNSSVNPLTSIARTQVDMCVIDNGNSVTLTDMAEERLLSAQEISLLAKLSGKLTPIGWYGAYDIQQPFDNSPDATRMIGVLQKQ